MPRPGFLPEAIGPYRVLQLLGEGGMGAVYLAERIGAVRGRVAVKVIKLGMDTREVLARFDQERRILERMDHSHIARVLDAGITDTGQPYFVMEYVPGMSLVRYCDERKLSVHARLELFQQVCDAVQHAHQKGVIHRDLTPRNILVKEENDKPVPKVIDFGLARAVDHTGVIASVFTEHGRIVGTPEYMSPEQAGLSPLDVDSRTDVYSLGVILYELLVGELPLGDLRAAGMLEMQRRIREEEPVPPSLRVGGRDPGSELHARDRGTTSHQLRRLVSQELDWIAQRALEKDRRRRFATVQSLSDQVGKFLRNEVLDVGPPSNLYRLRKWVARHRLGVIAAAAVLGSLVTGLVVSITFWREAVAAEQATRLDADVDLAAELLRALDEGLAPWDSTQVPAMEEWLARARSLIGRGPEHERQLEERRGRLAAVTAGPAQVRARLALERSELLRERVAKLTGAAGIARVERWLGMARSCHDRSVVEHAEAWRAAAAELAQDRRFAGVVLAPMEGLVPLGADARSGLQEFLVLDTGEVPPRRDGHLVPGPETGIVLVLLPPGEFTMRSTDARGRPCARSVRLEPFLVGKYEITQAQWRLLAGRNPSQWRGDLLQLLGDERLAAQRPVENVSLQQAETVLWRVGLRPTTEGQWEYACRAGQGDVLPWGGQPERIGEFANVVDLTARDHDGGGGPPPWPGIDTTSCRDGFVGTAPVGRLRANPFGLHDMFGNVHEWCRGGYREPPTDGVRDGDGLVLPADTSKAAVRGGGYTTDPATLGYQHFRAIERRNVDPNYGVRAARPLRR